MSLVVSLTAAIVGMVLGTAGFVMSLMSYLRDRPRLSVSVQWEMTAIPIYEKYALVKVANVGRRPVFISVVSIEMAKGGPYCHLILTDSVAGTKLSEGDKPADFTLRHEDLKPYSNYWPKVRAYVEDSAGKRYYSPFPDAKSSPPSWITSKS